MTFEELERLLQPVGDDAQGHGFDLGFGVRPGGAVGHDAGEGRNLGDPAAIVFLLEFDCEVHRSSIAKRRVGFWRKMEARIWS